MKENVIQPEDEFIKKAYDALFSPVMTPNALIDNARQANCSYVKFSMDKEMLVAEMKLKVEGESQSFFYTFNNRNHLEKIVLKVGKTKSILFDRQKEIQKNKADLINFIKNL